MTGRSGTCRTIIQCILVPNRRRYRLVNVVCVVVACIGGERGKRGQVWGWVRGLKMG
jgi:hypothetical protein